MNFNYLISQINTTHTTLYNNAVKAVNVNLTLQNWLIGYFIVAFEQKGEDRAAYGTQLLKKLATAIKIKRLGETNLKQCRKFFIVYPQISQTVSDFLINNAISIESRIGQTATDLL